MIIDIVETGGIYCYKKDNNILYIGKTKNNFNIRDQEHRNTNNPTEFEIILRQDNNISYEIIYDCSICPLTVEQLDYLETCLISQLCPKYNIHKKENKITKFNLTSAVDYINQNNNLTKSESIILNIINNYFPFPNTFSKKELQQFLDIQMSDSTFKRVFKKLIELNIIILLYSNANNENIYQLLK